MTGYIHQLRGLVGSQRIFVPGVRAVIVNEAGEVLLQYRSDMARWGVPGGAVEPDETAMAALRREVKEETSLTVLHAEPMALYCGPEQRFAYPNGDEVQCFAVAFVVRRWDGRPRADGREGTALRFFPLSGLPAALVAVHEETLGDFMRYEGQFLVR